MKGSYARAVQSFLGYLEGTDKSLHTIKNYHLDLKSFWRFVQTSHSASLPQQLPMSAINETHLKAYQDHLKAQGLRTNTRRRKLLTLHTFMNYLSQRKNVAPEMARRLPAPHKLERVPHVVDCEALIRAIRQMKQSSRIEIRNRLLLWTLAETGCLVSELGLIRSSHWQLAADGTKGSHLLLGGSVQRRVPISQALTQEVSRMREAWPDASITFPGYNRFGPLSEGISSRGVELLVRATSAELEFGELTPRIIRSSRVLHWLNKKVDPLEIQRRLGLKSAYALRAFESLLKSDPTTEPHPTPETLSGNA